MSTQHDPASQPAEASAPEPSTSGPQPSEPWALNPKPSSSPLAPGLYLVATPIGNLEDITLRALRVLASVDRIACEDTRQTAKLLSHFDLRVPTVSYHDHNETGRSAELVAALKSGGRIAVVSDAGTPAIADPGAVLVREAIAAGVQVFPIPGCNAALSALIASGLGTESFAFHGFLPAKEGARRTTLESLRTQLAAGNLSSGEPGHGSSESTTHLFYETPHRILGALEDVVAVFGPQHRIALARELTKLHEEFLRGTAAEVLATLQARPSIRGEMVLMLEGTLIPSDAQASAKTIADEVTHLMSTEGLSEKDALKRVAKSRGFGKSEAYREWQRSRR